MRTAEIARTTKETDIFLSLNLDGKGENEINTGCGFLDHMLTLFSRHSRIDLKVNCKGDTEVDYHHTAEDIAICLGKAIKDALGEKKGIERYADVILPMDEALILCAIDISGRGGLYFTLNIPSYRVGDFDTELCEEFFMALARESGITIHLKSLAGTNSHHIIEGAFKAFGRALKTAVAVDQKFKDEVPSTKGVI
ncbi:MAG: imidazoleglycerol-phosphate dehydratase HisB [Ruminococcaceae bacterium]|nr:imidazoleglycerol-phosphate dehydratase HisB [Oscillospiraceae bacterium]